MKVLRKLAGARKWLGLALDWKALRLSIALFAVCAALALLAAIAGFPPATVALLAVFPGILGIGLILAGLGAQIALDTIDR